MPASSLGKHRIPSPQREPEKRPAFDNNNYDSDTDTDTDIEDLDDSAFDDDDLDAFNKYRNKEADGPCEEYLSEISAYEGFYITDWNVPIRITGGLIWRCSNRMYKGGEGELRKALEFGFEANNEQLKEEDKDRVVDLLSPRKVVRANKQNNGATMYYITVQASDDKFYETQVWEWRGDYKLYLMRPALHYPKIEETYFCMDITRD